MKQIIRLITKITLRFLSFILILLIVIGGFYSVKGYQMYQNSIKDTPISNIAGTIQAKEDFTRYDELPSIYVDAVISAEDKRFLSHPGIDRKSVV